MIKSEILRLRASNDALEDIIKRNLESKYSDTTNLDLKERHDYLWQKAENFEPLNSEETLELGLLESYFKLRYFEDKEWTKLCNPNKELDI